MSAEYLMPATECTRCGDMIDEHFCPRCTDRQRALSTLGAPLGAPDAQPVLRGPLKAQGGQGR